MISALLANTATSYSYSYNSSTGTSNGNPVVAVILFAAVIVLVILLVAAMWKVFQKAGKPGWAIIVPFYNGWTLAEIAGKPGWWGLIAGISGIGYDANYTAHMSHGIVAFIGLVSLVSAAFYILIALGVARNFGKSTVWGVFLLVILPFIGYPILGLGKAQYQAGAAAGTVADNTPVSQPANAATPVTNPEPPATNPMPLTTTVPDPGQPTPAADQQAPQTPQPAPEGDSTETPQPPAGPVVG